MLNSRGKRRIVAGSTVGLILAAGMLTGASGASAHNAEQMEQLAPYLARHPQRDMLTNYLGGDGSLLRAYVAERRRWAASAPRR